LIGGEPGLTGKVKLKAAGTLAIGGNSFGFIGIGDPQTNGFYSDRIVATVSTAAYAGFVIEKDSTVLGVDPISFTESAFTAVSGASGLGKDIVSYRLVGLSVAVIPIGSALSQDGSMVLLEDPNHNDLGATTYSALASFRNARELSAIKFGEQKDKIVLNLHPRSSDNAVSGAFDFVSSPIASPTVITSAVAGIAIEGTPGLKFRFEIFGIYEARGHKVRNPSATLVDSAGMDDVLNVFRLKRVSGWVGQTHHAIEGYGHALVKAKKSVNNYGKWRQLWDAGKDVWHFAREVAGF
jgi:hypothetical protein